MSRLFTSVITMSVLPMALSAQDCSQALSARESCQALSARESCQAKASELVVPLSYRAQRKWKIRLPALVWKAVGTGFKLATTHGSDFVAKLDGVRLLVDVDGDGKTDVKAEGETAYLILRGKSKDGKPLPYAVRLSNHQGWSFAPGGFLLGKINGTQIRIIDQNNDGRFGEVGVDAMLLGRGKIATFLSKVVNVGGELFEIAVADDGSQLLAKPYVGPSGTVNLACSTNGKVLAAIIKSGDSQYSFDLAKTKDGMKVPAGSYDLVWGQIGLGESRVEMQKGRSQPILVAKDGEKTLSFGGPIKAEFAYQRSDSKVHLRPDKVWYYGKGGELYTKWLPIGASPKFSISDLKSGKELARAFFPGTC